MVAALALIWYIANNVFDLGAVVDTMRSGALTDVQAGITQLSNAPLFWLWIYVAFTVSNTMYPHIPKDLRGWRVIGSVVGVISMLLLLVGVGSEIFSNLAPAIISIINNLISIFTLIIIINVGVTAILGVVEWAVERVTGHSATFRKGKMITMTRAEALERTKREAERERKRIAARRNPAADSPLKTIYNLPFPIPGSPGQEPITQPRATVLGIEEPDKGQISLPGFQTSRISTDLITAIGRPSQPERLPESITSAEPAPELVDDQNATERSAESEVPGYRSSPFGARQVETTPEPSIIYEDEESDEEDFDEDLPESESTFADTAEAPGEEISVTEFDDAEKDLTETEEAPVSAYAALFGSSVDADESYTAVIDEGLEDETDEPDDLDSVDEDIQESDDEEPDSEEDLKPFAPFGASRSLSGSISPFGQRRSISPIDQDSESEESQRNKDTSRFSALSPRARLSPFTRREPEVLIPDDDEADDVEDDETVFARRGTGDDAVSELFTSLSSGFDPSPGDSEDLEEKPGLWGRPARTNPAQTGFSFGKSRPAPKPSFSDDIDDNSEDDVGDEIDYYDDDDDDVYYDDDDD